MGKPTIRPSSKEKTSFACNITENPAEINKQRMNKNVDPITTEGILLRRDIIAGEKDIINNKNDAGNRVYLEAHLVDITMPAPLGKLTGP